MTTKTKMIKCPHCEGMQTMAGFSNGRWSRLPCFQCEGLGEIPEEAKAWIRNGLIIREVRELLNIGLREGAEKWGMKPSEVSEIESGRSNNLTWGFCPGCGNLRDLDGKEYCEQCRVVRNQRC